ncbi:MAG: carboxypeptidase M32 [Armatimonadetes bacterium]|nr:carboxypeptidase M32 [Armatimonadota bacterium]
MRAIEQLQARLADVKAVRGAASVLGWDQQTYMPPGGAGARANQLSVLSKISHEMATGPDTERLLAEAERETKDADPDSDEASFVRVARRDYDQAAKLPTALVAELSRVTALAHEEWARARQDSDYPRFAPWLERILDLTRQVAQHLGYQDVMYDALLDLYEPGMKTREVRAMFDALRPAQVALVQAIIAKGPDLIDASPLQLDYDEATQTQFGLEVVRRLGFDFARGRQDRAVHPFCTSFSRDDVRITTRFDKNWPPMSLFGSIHETGHALYEQGVDPRYDGNTLEGGTSLGVHESQSRLWENLVGRSRPFWQCFYPSLQAAFPGALSDVPLESFYRAINRVWPSLIRVEADEVTYNLHILLRFELENDLLEGRLSVADAPQTWNAKMREYLGLTPENDAQGILQDVHWSGGSFGYFPTYTVGNLLSVQLFEKADADLGGQTADQVARGDFAPLLAWLREHVHQWGRKYDPSDLIRRVTGGPLDPAPYLRYLQRKYGEIYRM